MKKTSILFSKVVFGIASLVLILFIINLLTGCSQNDTLGKSLQNEELRNLSIPENIQNSNPSVDTVSIAVDMDTVPIAVEDIDDTDYLVLVNRDYPLMAEFNDSEFAQVLASVPTSPIGLQDVYLHSTALTAVKEMFDSARDSNVGALGVTTGYRGFDEQQELYDVLSAGGNGAYVLPAGYSEHHTGLAVDIGSTGINGADFGSSPQGRWLADNSYRFGMVLRYPKGAEDITGVNYESWHFRYVGKAHAYYMKENNLVFEEYIQLIQGQGSLSFEVEGVTYYILYQVPQDGIINIPDGLDYMLSSDNIGGYIVTAW